MSTSSAALPIHPAPEPRARPRRLVEVVPASSARRARPRVVHAIVAVLGLMAIVGVQLLLSIGISSGAYRIADLQAEQRALTREQEALGEQLEIRNATQYLANAAAHLGMVPAPTAFFLDLSTGGVATAPGMRDSVGCGGACNLVPNELTTGLPLVDPLAAPTAAAPGEQATATETATETATDAAAAPVGAVVTPSVQEGPVASDSIPAPVTH